MSNIVPFVPRPPDGDWTSGERARLGELAERLAAGGTRVQAAYGVSDAGDPWCVIQDEQDEVLIHIARIDGAFVIHDAAIDAVQEEDSLWSAMARLLGQAWKDGSTVIPMDVRQAQALLALIMAAVFVQQAIHDGQTVAAHAGRDLDLGDDPAATPQPHAPASADANDHDHGARPLHHDLDQVARSEDLGQFSRPWDRPSSEPAAGLQAPATGSLTAAAVAATPRLALAQPASPTPHAEPAGLVLTGGPGPDHLIGGKGADTLSGGGVGPGQIDLLRGGRGDDRIEMAAGVVARGGPGADTFVLTAQPAAPPGFATAAVTPGSGSDGVILDFGAGDHLVFANGAAAVIVSVTATADVLSGLHGATGLRRTPETPGVRVGVDLNGDGHEDVHVLVAGPGISSLTPVASTAVSTSAPMSAHHTSDLPVQLPVVAHHDILLA